MEFRIINIDDNKLREDIYTSYCRSFPEAERRNDDQFISLFGHPVARIFSITDEEESVGYLITWSLSRAVFIEHFEIFEQFRNRKYGSRVLAAFSEIHPRLVLETEPAHLDEIAERRVGFYDRNGFEIIDKNYRQPSYGDGKSALDLWLMTNYKHDDTAELVREIYETVYGGL